MSKMSLDVIYNSCFFKITPGTTKHKKHLFSMPTA